MDQFNIIQVIAIYALPVLLAITLHEAAHGYVALRFGDATAKLAGRLTLNPIKHIDLFGTIILPIIILATSSLAGMGGVLFGYAKPVPVNFSNLRHPKKDMLWVALAGPGVNLAMAIAWAILAKIARVSPDFIATPLFFMAQAGIQINIFLMLLNLIPIPPLDGGRVAVSLLPHRQSYALARIEPYGFWILLALLFSGILGTILLIPAQALIALLNF